MQVFELKSVTRPRQKLPDGSDETHEQELGVFDSVENAEALS